MGFDLYPSQCDRLRQRLELDGYPVYTVNNWQYLAQDVSSVQRRTLACDPYGITITQYAYDMLIEYVDCFEQPAVINCRLEFYSEHYYMMFVLAYGNMFDSFFRSRTPL